MTCATAAAAMETILSLSNEGWHGNASLLWRSLCCVSSADDASSSSSTSMLMTLLLASTTQRCLGELFDVTCNDRETAVSRTLRIDAHFSCLSLSSFFY